MFWGHRTGETDFANSTRLIEAIIDILLGYTSEFPESLRKNFIMESVKLVQSEKKYNEPPCTHHIASEVVFLYASIYLLSLTSEFLKLTPVTISFYL